MLKVTGGEGGDINFICPGARLALKVEKPPTRAHTHAHTHTPYRHELISKTEVDLMYRVLMNTLMYSFEQ